MHRPRFLSRRGPNPPDRGDRTLIVIAIVVLSTAGAALAAANITFIASLLGGGR